MSLPDHHCSKDPVTIAHVLCDHEIRLQAIEKYLGVKMPKFWHRRLAAAKKSGEGKEVIEFIKKKIKEEGRQR